MAVISSGSPGSVADNGFHAFFSRYFLFLTLGPNSAKFLPCKALPCNFVLVSDSYGIYGAW